jgi:BolA family transcriptional regulator, general stress-responsive regulator
LTCHGKALLCHLDADGLAHNIDGMTYFDRITLKLNEAFQPTSLDVIDESSQHHGHGGWREGGETHFRVRIASSAFAGKSRVEAHRMINTVLKDELAERVHALAIETRSA